MTLSRGRVLRSAELDGKAVPVELAATAPVPRGRRVPRDVVNAADQARRIVADAEERARLLVEAAARQAGDIRLRAEAEGRADGVAAVAAKAMQLAAHEARADERALDRTIELARLLAERLLGEALALDPTRIVALARRALADARGARRVRVVGHPDDLGVLEAERATLGAGLESLELVASPDRSRGDLRLETEIGVLDATLAPQLDRLAKRLRATITS